MITTNLPQSPIHVFLPLHKLRVSVVLDIQYLIYNIYIDIKDSIQPKIAAKKNDISTRFQLFENPKNALKKPDAFQIEEFTPSLLHFANKLNSN